jgi:1-acyl-sn-glycerol-3-phosphate acyltransferase
MPPSAGTLRSTLRTGREAVRVWGGVAWSTASLATLSCVLGPPTGGYVSRKLFIQWSRKLCRQLELELDVQGTHHIRSAGAGILVVNHNSLLDVPVLGAMLDVNYKWVAKRSLFRVPFVGWHLWLAGHIPIDRQRGGNMRKLEDTFRGLLAKNTSILFFPEGTRSEDGAMKRFRLGAFVTAVEHDVPVLPMVIDGVERLVPKGDYVLRSGDRKIRLRVLPPVRARPPSDARRPEADRIERAKELMQRTRAAMVTALDELRGAPGAAERPTLDR